MSDPKLIREVVERVRDDLEHEGDLDDCKLNGCPRKANGLDGFCEPHSRERERSGKWETIPFSEIPEPPS